MIEQLIAPVTGLLDKFVEDKDQKARLCSRDIYDGGASCSRVS